MININNILVTGSAGFIGSALTQKLLNDGMHVTGVDNHNNYYDPKLKEARISRYKNHKNYSHCIIDIENKEAIKNLFTNNYFEAVINLAAQPGVRYSLENPERYINTNILGFLNILEASKSNDIKHLVYASSSSIYGLNQDIPFSTKSNTDHPVSIYAATKKTNELMAHTYSHLYDIPTTGLRFFTVYGPWDRPDMALQSFTNSILNNQPIKLYNFGEHRRDFTYIDDIVEGIIRVLNKPPNKDKEWDRSNPDPSSSSAPYRIYNIGNNNMVKINKYIEILEKELGQKARKKLLPLQPGDVENTYADVEDLIKDFDYQPQTTIEEGISRFVKWYLEYYKKSL